MKEELRPLIVTIQCFTFNQAQFIRQCLDGFVMQKTDFRFEAIVHDDASTDGTADIIREYANKYPDIIKPIIESENLYSKHDGSLNKIMYNSTHGKYVAICEGDDYWTDSLKLQKQVEFLESHPDYSLVYGKCNYLNQKTGVITNGFQDFYELFPDLLNHNTIPTLTVLYKKAVFESYLNEVNPRERGWLMGDYPFWLYVSYRSKIHFEPLIMGVYRVLPESASHSSNIEKSEAFIKNLYKMKSDICRLFNIEYETNDYMYKSLVQNAYRLNNRSRTKCYLQQIRKKNLKVYMMIIVAHSSFLFKWSHTIFARSH
jgi:glycosyltransferase involved in cell wall biosynthesis